MLNKQTLVGFLKDATGATAIEYAVIATLIGMACVGALTQLGSDLKKPYVSATNPIQNAVQNSGN